MVWCGSYDYEIFSIADKIDNDIDRKWQIILMNLTKTIEDFINI